jgi:hypothetical protein
MGPNAVLPQWSVGRYVDGRWRGVHPSDEWAGRPLVGAWDGLS